MFCVLFFRLKWVNANNCDKCPFVGDAGCFLLVAIETESRNRYRVSWCAVVLRSDVDRLRGRRLLCIFCRCCFTAECEYMAHLGNMEANALEKSLMNWDVVIDEVERWLNVRFPKLESLILVDSLQDTVRLLIKSNHKKDDDHAQKKRDASLQWKRMLLLIIAITMHNIPEGMAVGVGFGAANATDVSSFEFLHHFGTRK